MVRKLKKLRLAGSSFSESVLIVFQDFVAFEMTHNVAHQYMFHDLTCDGREGDWPVVGWCIMLSFLKDGGDICLLPLFRDLACLQGMLEDGG